MRANQPNLNDLSILVNNVIQFMVLLGFTAEAIRKVADAYNEAIAEWNRVNVKEAKIIPIYPFLKNRKEVENDESEEGTKDPQE